MYVCRYSQFFGISFTIASLRSKCSFPASVCLWRSDSDFPFLSLQLQPLQPPPGLQIQVVYSKAVSRSWCLWLAASASSLIGTIGVAGCWATSPNCFSGTVVSRSGHWHCHRNRIISYIKFHSFSNELPPLLPMVANCVLSVSFGMNLWESQVLSFPFWLQKSARSRFQLSYITGPFVISICLASSVERWLCPYAISLLSSSQNRRNSRNDVFSPFAAAASV